jgi:hypothetical protein
MTLSTAQRRPLGLVTSAFLLILLTACGPSSNAKTLAASAAGLPPLPLELRQCFEQVYKMPGKKGTPFSNSQVVEIIGGLRGSEAEKTDCGRRLIAFYDDVSKGRK